MTVTGNNVEEGEIAESSATRHDRPMEGSAPQGSSHAGGSGFAHPSTTHAPEQSNSDAQGYSNSSNWSSGLPPLQHSSGAVSRPIRPRDDRYSSGDHSSEWDYSRERDYRGLPPRDKERDHRDYRDRYPDRDYDPRFDSSGYGDRDRDRDRYRPMDRERDRDRIPLSIPLSRAYSAPIHSPMGYGQQALGDSDRDRLRDRDSRERDYYYNYSSGHSHMPYGYHDRDRDRVRDRDRERDRERDYFGPRERDRDREYIQPFKSSVSVVNSSPAYSASSSQVSTSDNDRERTMVRPASNGSLEQLPLKRTLSDGESSTSKIAKLDASPAVTSSRDSTSLVKAEVTSSTQKLPATTVAAEKKKLEIPPLKTPLLLSLPPARLALSDRQDSLSHIAPAVEMEKDTTTLTIISEKEKEKDSVLAAVPVSTISRQPKAAWGRGLMRKVDTPASSAAPPLTNAIEPSSGVNLDADALPTEQTHQAAAQAGGCGDGNSDDPNLTAVTSCTNVTTPAAPVAAATVAASASASASTTAVIAQVSDVLSTAPSLENPVVEPERQTTAEPEAAAAALNIEFESTDPLPETEKETKETKESAKVVPKPPRHSTSPRERDIDKDSTSKLTASALKRKKSNETVVVPLLEKEKVKSPRKPASKKDIVEQLPSKDSVVTDTIAPAIDDVPSAISVKEENAATVEVKTSQESDVSSSIKQEGPTEIHVAEQVDITTTAKVEPAPPPSVVATPRSPLPSSQRSRKSSIPKKDDVPVIEESNKSTSLEKEVRDRKRDTRVAQTVDRDQERLGTPSLTLAERNELQNIFTNKKDIERACAAMVYMVELQKLNVDQNDARTIHALQALTLTLQEARDTDSGGKLSIPRSAEICYVLDVVETASDMYFTFLKGAREKQYMVECGLRDIVDSLEKETKEGEGVDKASSGKAESVDNPLSGKTESVVVDESEQTVSDKGVKSATTQQALLARRDEAIAQKLREIQQHNRLRIIEAHLFGTMIAQGHPLRDLDPERFFPWHSSKVDDASTSPFPGSANTTTGGLKKSLSSSSIASGSVRQSPSTVLGGQSQSTSRFIPSIADSVDDFVRGVFPKKALAMKFNALRNVTVRNAGVSDAMNEKAESVPSTEGVESLTDLIDDDSTGDPFMSESFKSMQRQLEKLRPFVSKELYTRKALKHQAWETLGDRFVRAKHKWDTHIRAVEKERDRREGERGTRARATNLSTDVVVRDTKEKERGRERQRSALLAFGGSQRDTGGEGFAQPMSISREALQLKGPEKWESGGVDSLPVQRSPWMGPDSDKDRMRSKLRWNSSVHVFADDVDSTDEENDTVPPKPIDDKKQLSPSLSMGNKLHRKSMIGHNDDKTICSGNKDPDMDSRKSALGHKHRWRLCGPSEHGGRECVSASGVIGEVIDDMHNNRLTLDGKRQSCAFLGVGTACAPNCNCALQVERLSHSLSQSALWTDVEKSIFLDKFLQFPKNFHRIASFLSNKTTKDCVKFYYDSKHLLDLKQLLRECDTRNRRVAAGIEKADKNVTAAAQLAMSMNAPTAATSITSNWYYTQRAAHFVGGAVYPANLAEITTHYANTKAISADSMPVAANRNASNESAFNIGLISTLASGQFTGPTGVQTLVQRDALVEVCDQDISYQTFTQHPACVGRAFMLPVPVYLLARHSGEREKDGLDKTRDRSRDPNEREKHRYPLTQLYPSSHAVSQAIRKRLEEVWQRCVDNENERADRREKREKHYLRVLSQWTRERERDHDEDAMESTDRIELSEADQASRPVWEEVDAEDVKDLQREREWLTAELKDIEKDIRLFSQRYSMSLSAHEQSLSLLKSKAESLSQPWVTDDDNRLIANSVLLTKPFKYRYSYSYVPKDGFGKDSVMPSTKSDIGKTANADLMDSTLSAFYHFPSAGAVGKDTNGRGFFYSSCNVAAASAASAPSAGGDRTGKDTGKDGDALATKPKTAGRKKREREENDKDKLASPDRGKKTKGDGNKEEKERKPRVRKEGSVPGPKKKDEKEGVSSNKEKREKKSTADGSKEVIVKIEVPKPETLAIAEKKADKPLSVVSSAVPSTPAQSVNSSNVTLEADQTAAECAVTEGAAATAEAVDAVKDAIPASVASEDFIECSDVATEAAAGAEVVTVTVTTSEQAPATIIVAKNDNSDSALDVANPEAMDTTP